MKTEEWAALVFVKSRCVELGFADSLCFLPFAANLQPGRIIIFTILSYFSFYLCLVPSVIVEVGYVL